MHSSTPSINALSRSNWLTDLANVYTGFGTKNQKAIKAAHPDILESMGFAAGSMGPKVLGACKFVRETGKDSAIGQLSDLNKILDGKAGTLISNDVDGIQFEE
jgi:carbamate kinase